MYGWTPKIGDPTLLGWSTVIAYAVAAAACALAWRQSAAGAERRTWLALALFAGFLCVNKQLDLQSLGTAIAKAMAKEQGWYEHRRLYQTEFIAVLSGAALVLAVTIMRMARRLSGSLRLALAGAILLTAFILVRASSFHHVDWFLAVGLGGVRTNHLLELGGIALLAGAAFARWRKGTGSFSAWRAGSEERRA